MITLLAVTGLTHRQSYKDIFAITCIKTWRSSWSSRFSTPPVSSESTEFGESHEHHANPSPPRSLRASDTGKVVSARDAVRLIRDGDTVATGGFVGIGFAENIAVALEQHFLETRRPMCTARAAPRNLTLGMPPAGRWQGARPQPFRPRRPGRPRHRRALGPAPRLQQLAVANRIEATTCPGVITHLFRDIAAASRGRSPGSASAPSSIRVSAAAKLNERRPPISSGMMEIDGEEYLFYKAFPIHVGIIRGTTADPDGNITMERRR